MNRKLCALTLAAFFLTQFPLQAGAQDRAYLDYINQYSSEAVKQMEKYGIPASITLAQGILESDAGRSMLAIEGNNHFGIKCHSDWRGEAMYHDDDRANECFREYSSAKESYEDHSAFLRSGARYSELFELEPTDYKGWAKGLKKAGYATSSTYADKLINLIETYDLDEYDKKGLPAIEAENAKEKTFWSKFKSQVPAYGSINRTEYVIINEGETLKDIARNHKMLKLSLRLCNDLPKGITPEPGNIIYLERKKFRAEKGNEACVVGPDDSLWSISQKYGIRLKSLMRKNNLETATIETGQALRLR